MKKDWIALRPKVLRRIRPTAAFTRRARSAARRVQERAKALAKTEMVGLDPVLVGSLGKDTHVLPAPDIDVFLLFPPTTSREQLEIGRASCRERV